MFSKKSFRITIRVPNSLDQDVRPDLGPNCLQSYQQTTLIGKELTLHALMDSYFWFDTINLGSSIVYMDRSQVIIPNKNCISFSEDNFCLTKHCRS